MTSNDKTKEDKRATYLRKIILRHTEELYDLLLSKKVKMFPAFKVVQNDIDNEKLFLSKVIVSYRINRIHEE